MASFYDNLSESYIYRFDYDGSNNLLYKGRALPGSASSDAAWAIQKYTYTGGNLTLIQWANGDNALNKIWDNRAALSYA